MFISRNQLEKYYRDPKKLDSDLKLVADSSAEDDLLFEWLTQENDVWPVLSPVFERRVGTRKGFEAWLLEADRQQFQLSPEFKRVGAFFVILELREFAGHTLWNRFGKIPHYEDIVKVVHERVADRFKMPKRGDMSVADRELSLSALVLKESLEQLSLEKVSDILRESNFETTSDFSELKSGLLKKLGSAAPSTLNTLIGKSFAKKIGTKMIESAFGAGRLAGAGRFGNIAAQVLPVAFKRAGLYVSLGFLMKDAYDLGGEATRVTNPAVIIISLYRSFSGR